MAGVSLNIEIDARGYFQKDHRKIWFIKEKR
jgi:hypothetical protein